MPRFSGPEKRAGDTVAIDLPGHGVSPLPFSYLHGDAQYVADALSRIEGPVVEQLTDAFADDWQFTTGEQLDDAWFPKLEPVGTVLARVVPSGPDEDMEQIEFVTLSENRVLVVLVFNDRDELVDFWSDDRPDSSTGTFVPMRWRSSLAVSSSP